MPSTHQGLAPTTGTWQDLEIPFVVEGSVRVGSSHWGVGARTETREIHLSRVRMFKAAKYGSHVLK